MNTLVVRSRQVVTGGEVRPASIAIHDGLIAAVGDYDDFGDGSDFGDAVVMPGLVDTHVHMNEPGRSEWEGFATATRAAAAGGVTTLIEMPLNSIPATTSVDAFRHKLAATCGQLWVDVGFWGGMVPGNTAELRGLYEAGVFGFKCFLVPSGVPEFEAVSEAELREALPVLASLDAVLLAHCELPGPIAEAATRPYLPIDSHNFESSPWASETASDNGGAATSPGTDPRQYATWLRARPCAAENQAVALLIRLSREFDAPVHVVHLSSSEALPCLRRAREEGVKITVETCPHYLSFAAEQIPDGATEFKCAPPIRESQNRERLWDALKDGTIDLVASDHSPCPPRRKCSGTGDFVEAWGGISSLQLSLPVMWTRARERGLGMAQLSRWLCAAPTKLARLKRKGAIAVGHYADLVVWDPDATFRVEANALYHRHKLTPYAGQTLHGVVRATFLRGEKIYDAGHFPAAAVGRPLRRGET